MKHARSFFVLPVVAVVAVAAAAAAAAAAVVGWLSLGHMCMNLLDIAVKLVMRNCDQQEKGYDCVVALEGL